jgi:biopolymer transport protein ExbD
MSRIVDEEVGFNLTPLIDVVFVILILFMVMAPLLEKESVSLAPAPEIPIEALSAVEKQGKFVVHVHSDDTITFNHHSISLEQLGPLLVQAQKRFPKETPQLFHDQKGTFGTYQKIKNLAQDAGFKQIDVILQP